MASTSLWAHVEQTAPHLLNERPAKGFFLETSCKVPWSVSSKRQIGRVSRIRGIWRHRTSILWRQQSSLSALSNMAHCERRV